MTGVPMTASGILKLHSCLPEAASRPRTRPAVSAGARTLALRTGLGRPSRGAGLGAGLQVEGVEGAVLRGDVDALAGDDGSADDGVRHLEAPQLLAGGGVEAAHQAGGVGGDQDVVLEDGAGAHLRAGQRLV